MAQAIHCDVHDRAHLADVLVTTIANGDAFAACAAGYLEVARAMVAGADGQEADATDAEAIARLEGQPVQDAPGAAEEPEVAAGATPEPDAAPGPSPAVLEAPGGEEEDESADDTSA